VQQVFQPQPQAYNLPGTYPVPQGGDTVTIPVAALIRALGGQDMVEMVEQMEIDPDDCEKKFPLLEELGDLAGDWNMPTAVIQQAYKDIVHWKSKKSGPRFAKLKILEKNPD
jgi:hypothetical protein